MKSLYFAYLAQNAAGGWTPGIGDPTFTGWFTVVCYFAAAYLCYRNTNALSQTGRFDTLSATWWILTFVLVFLGINKQLDLQSLLFETGRRVAIEQQWYANRQLLQKAFIMAVVTGGIVTLSAGAWILRKHLRSLSIVFLGMTMLMTFIVVRAAYFQHIERFVGHRITGLRTVWVLELGSLALIGWGALKRTR